MTYYGTSEIRILKTQTPLIGTFPKYSFLLKWQPHRAVCRWVLNLRKQVCRTHQICLDKLSIASLDGGLTLVKGVGPKLVCCITNTAG